MREFLGAIVVGALALPCPALALEFYEERGGWEIAAGADACGMSLEYEGDGATELHLLQRPGEEGYLIAVTNSNWSTVEHQEYDITFSLNGNSYGGGLTFGYRDSYKRGFVGSVAEPFGRDFAAGSSLYILLGDSLVDQLSLAGTAVAMQSLARCSAKLGAEMDAERREKERFAHIPKDPFAKPPPPPGQPTDPVPIDIARLANMAQYRYPTAPDGSHPHGKVGITVIVGPDGEPRDCLVTGPSGNSVLDEAACNAARRYARFTPAKDGEGRPVEGRWSTTITYNQN